MRTFLICPVRGHELSETDEIVARLEGEGYQVYWPGRESSGAKFEVELAQTFMIPVLFCYDEVIQFINEVQG